MREAFEFYRSVFGGEFGALITYGDQPDAFPVAASEYHKILYVALPVGSSTLRGSDVPEESGSFAIGDNVHIYHETESREECERRFAALAERGKVTTLLQDMVWGAYYGSLTDRFGVQWMLSHRG